MSSVMSSRRSSVTTVPMRTSSGPSMATERFHTAASSSQSSPRVFLSLSQSNRGHKYYAVKVGRETGIFTSWADASAVTQGYKGNSYQGFNTREEAERFMARSDYAPPPSKRSIGYNTPSEDLVEALNNFTLDSEDDGEERERRRRTLSNSTYYTASTSHHRVSSPVMRSPPRSSPVYGGGSALSYGHTGSSVSTIRLDALSESYLKTHHYPPAQVARIRRVFLRRADDERIDGAEILEGLLVEGMDLDKAKFLLRLVYREYA
ncbi:hypothetical protein FRB94_004873 [Tulasnella sp. JGI-2019a]|nr:hypothetical protein FRB93_005808 [Tulasnella sp. JGI-2019a]KAG9001220.1 hypothetical protein FRB94_004873 [Tulasnella sp. JGI-2019a]KAG9025546.1 hypothetical protein FRB95_010072 [Tulasnella sp. JGI-2019a]